METLIIERGQIVVPAPIRKRYRLSKRSTDPFRIVLLELFSLACRERGEGEDVAAVRHTIFKQSGIRILWEVEGPPLLAAGRIKACYRLSTADAIFAACALREKCIYNSEHEPLSRPIEVENSPYP